MELRDSLTCELSSMTRAGVVDHVLRSTVPDPCGTGLSGCQGTGVGGGGLSVYLQSR